MINKGIFSDRLKPEQDNPREVAFAEQWEYENENSNILNKLISSEKEGWEISDRDREVAATLIQWLGSNVGIGFLIGVLGREPEMKKYLGLNI